MPERDRERADTGEFDDRIPVERVRVVFDTLEDSAEPLDAGQVAERANMARRTAHNKLNDLVERDDLRTRKVGARGRVWWMPDWCDDDHVDRASDDRPGDADQNGRESPPTADDATGDAPAMDTDARSDAPPEATQTDETNGVDTASPTGHEDER